MDTAAHRMLEMLGRKCLYSRALAVAMLRAIMARRDDAERRIAS